MSGGAGGPARLAGAAPAARSRPVIVVKSEIIARDAWR